MKNTLSESTIPCETMVVEYVAGNLSENAQQQFEASLKNDVELQNAVAFEHQLRSTSKSVLMQSEQYQASDNFDALLKRIEQDACLTENSDIIPADLSELNANELSTNSQVNTSVTSYRSRLTAAFSKPLSIAASFAALGIAATLLLKPITSDLLAPDYIVLSCKNTNPAEQVSLNSLSAESRVAKIVLSESLDNAAINNMLAAYQLQLISNLPEQASLIVLAEKAIDASRLTGISNDERVQNVSLIKASE